ncbi:efflux RND transporter permease subunit [Trueperella bialowiezensis]|uniref:Swarming motility protein SwrC n=1 Tax=Trueperella bialowiezensis TaxID=312285 RepID=A0A3S5EW23_9ACTO|nr:efflux RND transporter permease subunit [Trueperella bialowiezensis]VEI13279.1 Swarming motility protein SwrC [Trueperella bialowiezensis]
MFKLSEGSLKNRAFVALVSIVIAVLGTFCVGLLRQELIPRIELPVINVLTVSPGATSEQMRDRVSIPVEQRVMTIPEVANTTTRSSSSVSFVTIELDYGTDVARAANRVELAINRADENFPENADYQVIAGGSSDIPLAYVAITSEGTPLETAERIRNTVMPELEKISGVASAELIAAPEQNISITLNAERVAELGISPDAIEKALDDNGLSVPVGTLVEGGQAKDVTVGNQLDSIEALRAIPIVAGDTEAGQPATVYPLSEIAQVEFTDGARDMVGRIDGEDAIAIVIFPTANANIVDTSAEVGDALDRLAPSVGGNTEFTMLFDQAPYITGSIESLAQEGLLGLIFAVLVILVFLFSVRSTLVTAISIPLSLLAGFIGMYVGGYSLNMLTLAALTLSIGRVVDDSIVVIENIKRHLDYGKDKRDAVLDGVREVSSAITASTIVSFIVFVPIGLVPGLVGELFRPFAFTVVIALAASLLVALTIVPVLAYWFLKPAKAALVAQRTGELEEYQQVARRKEERYWLRRAYEPVLRGTQKRPVVTLLVALVILGASVAMFPLLKINLLGSANQGSISLTQEVEPGSSTQAQVEAAAEVEQALSEVPGTNTIGTLIGANPMTGVPQISYFVSIDEDADVDQITDALQAAGDAVAGEGALTTSTEGMLGSGTIDVNITAPDPQSLAQATDDVQAALAELAEVKAVEHNLAAEAPAVQVTVDRDAVAAVGLTENDVVGMIAAQMVEPEIGTIAIDNVDTAIKLSINDPVTSVDELRAMTIMGQPIAAFAQIEEVGSIPTIVTINGQTTATVSATPVATDNLGEASAAVERALADVDLPDGAVTIVGGSAEQLAESFEQLIYAIAAAILLIYVVLVWIFKSLVQPALLLVAIPFAAIGSFGALLLTDTPLDLSAMIGLLMLTGIVVTNAVVLVDLMNQYRERGYELGEAVHAGAMRRVRPVVMTSLATIAAMTPMALGVSSATGFISTPLAITVIGGLITSTLLTLVLLPVLYRLVEGAKERAAARRAAKVEAMVAAEVAKDADAVVDGDADVVVDGDADAVVDGDADVVVDGDAGADGVKDSDATQDEDR